MSYYLFLDDYRHPSQVSNLPPSMNWKIVKNFNEFKHYIEEHGLPKHVAFDHDLADFHYGLKDSIDKPADYGTEKTGYDCATWLTKYCETNNLPFPTYTIHSMNPIGKERIRNHIDDFKRRSK